MFMNILSGMAEVTLEVINGIFSGSENESKDNSTYEYWKDLSYDDQQSYFENNEYLKIYMNTHYYQYDRNLTAKKVQELSEKLNRDFTNKYNRF